MGKLRNFKRIDLGQIIDSHDGKLSVAESDIDIPFKIKRVYYIYDFDSNKSIRGYHAHKTLEQVLFCISGSFTLKLFDGINYYEEKMNKPNIGLFIGKYIWHTMHNFSDNCIILVLASEHFDETDYIRDFNNFKKIINEKKIENQTK
tara:strand:+ start:79 stop:519 length:441 start_codon:yes stop_codon:yes gene_type:complete